MKNHNFSAYILELWLLSIELTVDGSGIVPLAPCARTSTTARSACRWARSPLSWPPRGSAHPYIEWWIELGTSQKFNEGQIYSFINDITRKPNSHWLIASTDLYAACLRISIKNMSSKSEHSNGGWINSALFKCRQGRWRCKISKIYIL